MGGGKERREMLNDADTVQMRFFDFYRGFLEDFEEM